MSQKVIMTKSSTARKPIIIQGGKVVDQRQQKWSIVGYLSIKKIFMERLVKVAEQLMYITQSEDLDIKTVSILAS